MVYREQLVMFLLFGESFFLFDLSYGSREWNCILDKQMGFDERLYESGVLSSNRGIVTFFSKNRFGRLPLRGTTGTFWMDSGWVSIMTARRALMCWRVDYLYLPVFGIFSKSLTHLCVPPPKSESTLPPHHLHCAVVLSRDLSSKRRFWGRFINVVVIVQTSNQREQRRPPVISTKFPCLQVSPLPISASQITEQNLFDMAYEARRNQNSRCWLFLAPRFPRAINPFMTTFSVTCHAWRRAPDKNFPEPCSRLKLNQGRNTSMTSLATRSNSRNQYNGTYILGRWVYAGYLRSFNEAIRVGIANSSGLTRRSLTAELLNIKADMSIAVENQNSALILLPTNSTNTQESPALVNPKKMCRFRR